MRISGVSFTGLWEKGIPQKVGNMKNQRHAPIYNQPLIYHPFKDENQKSVLANASQFKNKIVCSSVHQDDIRIVDAAFIPNVTVGDRLKVTESEYLKMREYSEQAFDNKHNIEVYNLL